MKVGRQPLTKKGLRAMALRQRQMEAEIGLNPKYRSGPRASAEEIAAWEAKAHAWLRDHGRKR